MQSVRFEIGTRVRLLSTYPAEHAPPGGFPELTGTIISAHLSSYGVLWDRLKKGWGVASKDHSGWFVDGVHLALLKAPPTVATDLRLKPQAKTVLRHLRAKGHISPMEALVVYSISRLAACIHDLRKAGYDVSTVIKQDAQGHGYAQYALVVH